MQSIAAAPTGSPLADPMPRRRRRYHMHLPGIVYGLTTVFLAVGAINSQNNLLFWAFGVAIAGLLVSGVISGASLVGIEVERAPVEPVIAGGTLRVRYRVRNRNRLFPAFGLHLSELPESRGATGWRAILSPPEAFVAHIGPGQTVEAEARVTALRRGEGRLDRLSVWTVFPFGLTKKSVTFAQGRRVVVRPVPLELDDRVVRASREPGLLAAKSQRRSPTPGEFFALREHREGDSPRSVAWRASARAGALLTRQFTSARAARLWILLELDTDAERGERAIGLAAGAVEVARAGGSPAGLIVPAVGLRTPAREGRGHADALLDALAALPAATTATALSFVAPDPSPGDLVVALTPHSGPRHPSVVEIVVPPAPGGEP